MWLVAADIARFVDYVSVCLIVWYTGELCKQLNRWTRRLESRILLTE